MRLRHLLDTDTVSDIVLRPQGKVAAEIARRGESSICTSVVVAAELRFGAARRGSLRLSRQVEAVLSVVRVLPLEEPADRHYAELRARLERDGTPIGPNDMLIAAHALALRLTVVTGHAREFSRVPGLAVDNWLA
jgi:tRNA(fMet)-specific endonuclease VapC